MTKTAKKIVPTPKEERKSPHWKALNRIIDPEVGIGIVDLGLIYQINIDDDSFAHVIMTLTSPSCPVGPMLLQQVEDAMRIQEDVEDVQVEIVWDPFWTQERIDPDIRELMFGI